MHTFLKPSLICLALALPAAAIPVVNGGFETGDFSGWTRSGNSGFDGVTGASVRHTGNFGAFFGAVGSTSTISQTLATNPGETYTISYWLRSSGGSPTFFSTDFAGVVGQSFTNAAPFGYTQFSYTALAATASSTLNFTFRNDPDFWYLDDITVTAAAAAAPELNGSASTLPLVFMAVGLGLVGSRRRPQTAC